MVNIERGDIIEISMPEVLTYKNVMFWEPESKRLVALKQNGEKTAGAILRKAQIFLENNCIEPKGTDWICKPLVKYNSHTYTIKATAGGFECNCQGFGKNQDCSHCIAVRQFIFMSR